MDNTKLKGRMSGKVQELAFDYWEKICVLTQFTPAFR